MHGRQRPPWTRCRGIPVVAERALPALLLIALAAVLGLVLRLVHLGADPPLELSRSNAEVMDAGWYLAPAVERARGRPSSVPPQYDKPLVRWTAAPFFAGGVSLERAHAWAASWGLLLVIFGAGAAWTAFGRRAAVFAAVLLASSFLLVGYGRTPVVYGPLCACLAGVAWLHAAALGRWAAPGAWSCAGARVASLATAALAWVALGAVALALKEAAVVAAPGLALGWIAAVRRRGFAAGLLAAGTILAATVLWLAEPQLLWLTWHKAVLYFGDAQPLAVLKRLLAAPFQSGVAGKAPVVCALAWLGVLGALRPQAQAQTAGEGGPGPMRALPSRAFAAALAGWLGSWLIVFGMFSYHEPGYQQATPPPTRYFVPLLVPAALLGAGWLGRLSAGGAPLAPPRLAFALPWAALGAYWALGAVLTESWPLLAGTDGAGAPGWLVRAVRFPVLAAVGLLAGGALAVAVVRRARRQLRAGAHAPGPPPPGRAAVARSGVRERRAARRCARHAELEPARGEPVRGGRPG
ncbi:MAG: hypothetical protein KatS3mg102_0826 [Planctomycetota bacterium]|nr:MAG: hypothetical protein KatS3mg102_0826 [Planctomycetota bacterium]